MDWLERRQFFTFCAILAALVGLVALGLCQVLESSKGARERPRTASAPPGN